MLPTGRQQDRLLRVAVCEVSPEDQEWLANSLRAHGINSRVSPFFNAQGLSSMVAASEVDVVVWGEGATGCSLEQAVDSAGDTPLVVAANEFPNDLLVRARLVGASDVYVRGQAQFAVKVLNGQAEVSWLRRQAQAALAAAEDTDRRCDALIEAVGDPIAYLSEGLHVKANQAYLDLVGLKSFDDLEGMSILDFVSPDSTEQVREKIKRLGRSSLPPEEMDVALASGKSVPMMFSSAYYDGEPCLQITVQRPAAPVSVSVLPGAVAGTVANMPPPPSLEAWMKKDASSGLFTRGHFVEQLAQAQSGHCWVIQLEHHDKILATVGPTRLDQVMSAFGKLALAHFGEGSLVARWSGSMVSILAPDLGKERMFQIQQDLAREFLEVADRSFQSPIVAGGVVLNESMDSDEVATLVDQALSEARATPSGLCLVDPMGKVKARAARVAGDVAALKKALDEDGFIIHYHPIVSLMGGPEAYEVMLSMPQEKDILDSTGVMALAADSGLALDVDKWLVDKAVSDLAALLKQGKSTHLLVSISPSAIAEPVFSAYIEECLGKSRVPADRLAFQTPMAVALTQAKQTLEFKRSVADRGHAFLISNVPMDPDALRSLAVLEPSWIRLSAAATQQVSQSPDGSEALEKMILAASKEGVRVLVGFVEDALVLTTLFSLGVDSAQGNFLSPPLPAMTYDFSQFMG